MGMERVLYFSRPWKSRCKDIVIIIIVVGASLANLNHNIRYNHPS